MLVLCSKSWWPTGQGVGEERGGISPHLFSLDCDEVPLALRLSFNCPSAKESCKRRPSAFHPGCKGFIHCPMTRTLTPDPACPHAHTASSLPRGRLQEDPSGSSLCCVQITDCLGCKDMGLGSLQRAILGQVISFLSL